LIINDRIPYGSIVGTDLSAREAADRLGVELATIYAYASRGALTRRPAGDGRRSLYDADEVEALARRARPRSARRRIAAVDVVIGTTISEIGDGWIRYRGVDVADLAGHQRFESVCGLLWTGSIDHDPWVAASGGVGSAADAARASRALPAGAPVRARLAIGAAAASAHLAVRRDKGTAELEPTQVGPVVIDALIAALGAPEGSGSEAGHSVARRLWRRISPLPCTTARERALDVALVLLAEHELATSTLAARVAASTRAGAPEVVAAGLAAVSGPLHGRAAVRVHRHLTSPTPTPLDAPTATMGDGLGHVVHRRGDPRFAPLLARARSIATAPQRRRIDAVLAVDPSGPPPNVDAALAALALAARADIGATEAIFAIARSAGWLAHGWEEVDEAPLRYRGRTLYRGPRR
jgi:citrate synthase